MSNSNRTGQSSRKEQIIDSSLSIILNEGIHKLTIKNLSAQLGCVESAIYRHYPSKQAILHAVISSIEEICDAVLTTAETHPGNVLDQIDSYIRNWNQVYQEKPYIIPVLFSKELLRVDPTIPPMIRRIIQRQNTVLDQVISQGQERGEIPAWTAPHHLRLILISPWVLLLDDWFYSGRTYSLPEASAALLQETAQLLHIPTQSHGKTTQKTQKNSL